MVIALIKSVRQRLITTPGTGGLIPHHAHATIAVLAKFFGDIQNRPDQNLNGDKKEKVDHLELTG
jgi:hypothetical protein